MITKDKYGFIEDTDTKLPANAARKDDPIGRYLKAPGYIQNHTITGVRFDRFYFADRVAIDIFKKSGADVDREIQVKKRIAKREKIKYIPVPKGTELTLKELKQVLRED